MAMHSQFSLNPFEVIFRILQFRKIFTIDWKSSSTATTTKKEKQTFLYRCTEHESFSIFYAIFQIPIYTDTF